MDKVRRCPQESRVVSRRIVAVQSRDFLMRAQASPIRTTAGGTLFYRRQVIDNARRVLRDDQKLFPMGAIDAFAAQHLCDVKEYAP